MQSEISRCERGKKALLFEYKRGGDVWAEDIKK